MRSTLLLAAAVAIVALMPSAASACSIVPVETAADAVPDSADVVFIGVATESISRNGDAIDEFDVLEVFKGDVGRTTTVGRVVDQGTCGRSSGSPLHTPLIVFGFEPNDVDARWEGGGIRPTMTTYDGVVLDIRAETERVYGPPHPPAADARTDTITW